MQKRFTWIGLTALCLAAYVPGCNPAPKNASVAESPASQLEQRLPKHDFGYGYGHREPIGVSDCETGQSLYVCTVQGGPVTDQDGGIGLFDKSGRLLDWRRIEGLAEKIEETASLRVESPLPDSIVLRAVTSEGTGCHEDSLVVITIMNQRLVETFRGPGNLTSVNPVREEGALPQVEQRITKLVFAHLEEGEFNSLVMMSYHEPERLVKGKSEARVYVYDRARRLFALQQGTAVAGRHQPL